MFRRVAKVCVLGVVVGHFALLSACTSEPSDEAIERAVGKVAEKGRQAAIDQRNKEIEQINAVRGAIQ